MSVRKGDGRSTVYNDITSPEKMEQVNPDNLELEADYLEYLSSIGRAKSTIYQYEHNLHIFWCWNLDFNKNKFFVNMKKREFSKFQSHAINEWGWSPKRVRTVKATISSLSNFIENILDDEYEGYKPIVLKIESPADTAVRTKTVFKMDELQSLLDYLVENEEYMKACVLSLAMNNGRRKAEIPRFKVNYFDDKNLICEGALYKTPEKMVTKGRGIQGKLLDVYTLAKPFKPYFDLWMEERKRLKIRSEWLFPRREGGKWMDKPMKTETLDSWAQTFSALMKKPFYWHSLRHFFTTRLAEANLPDSVIQDIIGWSSGDMIKLYNDMDKDKAFDKYFGANGIKDVRQSELTEL